jgi:hypothetical protein
MRGSGYRAVHVIVVRDGRLIEIQLGDPRAQRNDIAKAKRRLDASVKEGRLQRVDTDAGEPGLWTLAEGVHAGGVRGRCTRRPL